MCVTLIRRLCPLVNLCIPYLGVCSLIKMCLSGSLGEKRPIGKGRRKPLDVCWLNQHLLFFFLILQLNSVPLQTWFQRCRADGEGSDLRWAMWCIEKSPAQNFLPSLLSMLGVWPSSVQATIPLLYQIITTSDPSGVSVGFLFF